MISPGAWYILPLAFILDALIGDPQTRFHPIRGMGKAILIAEPLFRRIPLKPVLSVMQCRCRHMNVNGIFCAKL